MKDSRKDMKYRHNMEVELTWRGVENGRNRKAVLGKDSTINYERQTPKLFSDPVKHLTWREPSPCVVKWSILTQFTAPEQVQTFLFTRSAYTSRSTLRWAHVALRAESQCELICVWGWAALIRLTGQSHFLSWHMSSSRAPHSIVMVTLHKFEGHMCWHRPPSAPCGRYAPSQRWAEVCFECSPQINPSFSEDDTGPDLSYWLDLKPERKMP